MKIQIKDAKVQDAETISNIYALSWKVAYQGIVPYIHSDYFRKGYGQKLLDVALSDMKKGSFQNCFLWVLKENKNARHFYEKNGFRCNQDVYNLEIMGKQLTDIRYVIHLNSDH